MPDIAIRLLLLGLHLYSSGWGTFIGHDCVSAPADFSPDNSRVCFASPKTGRGDIYSAKVDGSDRIRLTRTLSTDTMPIYSPDGRYIAIVRSSMFVSDVAHIGIMDADGKHPRQLTHGNVCDANVSATWTGGWRFSDDSKQVYFERSILVTPNERDDIPMAVNVDGTGLVERKREKGRDDGKIASPDGEVLLETRRSFFAPASYRIWVVPARGGEVRFLTEGYRPFFTRDGQRVFFTVGQQYGASSLWVINLDGTGKRKLDIPDGYRSPHRLSRDGHYLAISVYGNDGSYGVYLVNLNDYSVRMIDV